MLYTIKISLDRIPLQRRGQDFLLFWMRRISWMQRKIAARLQKKEENTEKNRWEGRVFLEKTADEEEGYETEKEKKNSGDTF